jgi:hypothetical protein
MLSAAWRSAASARNVSTRWKHRGLRRPSLLAGEHPPRRSFIIAEPRSSGRGAAVKTAARRRAAARLRRAVLDERATRWIDGPACERKGDVSRSVPARSEEGCAGTSLDAGSRRCTSARQRRREAPGRPAWSRSSPTGSPVPSGSRRRIRSPARARSSRAARPTARRSSSSPAPTTASPARGRSSRRPSSSPLRTASATSRTCTSASPARRRGGRCARVHRRARVSEARRPRRRRPPARVARLGRPAGRARGRRPEPR